LEPEHYGYVLGTAQTDELTRLATALVADGRARVLVITQAEGERAIETAAIESAKGVSLLGAAPCNAPPPHAGTSRYPLDSVEHEKEKKDGVMVVGSRSCGKLVLDEAQRYAKAPLTFGFTLESWPGSALGEKLTRGTRALAMSAGYFPFGGATLPSDEEL